MPKIAESKKLTEAVTIKLNRTDYEQLQLRADRQMLPLAEWSRDRLLESLNWSNASLSDHALLAEIAATQDIVVGLFCAQLREGGLTIPRAQKIVDEAHNRKYRDVAALFKYARSKVEAMTIGPGPDGE